MFRIYSSICLAYCLLGILLTIKKTQKQSKVKQISLLSKNRYVNIKTKEGGGFQTIKHCLKRQQNYDQDFPNHDDFDFEIYALGVGSRTNVMCGDKSVSRPDPLHQPLQQQRQKKGKLLSLWNIKTHLP